jgi:flagellar biosynthesis/type III secretory pathway M-ring protein FliF/YscJ
VSKVRQQLAFIPDALITVTVQMPETDASANIGRAATQASATIVANTARRLSAAAPVSRRELDIASVVSASIAVPRSYFVRIYQRSNPKLAEPSDGILQPIIDSELDKIRKLVKSCLSIKNEDDVTVESYYDFTPLPAVPTTETASSLPLLAFFMGSRNAQIALGVTTLFAFVALPLMLRRRPQPGMVSSRPIHAALLAPRRLEDFENDQEFDESDEQDPSEQHRLQLEDLAADDPNAAAEVVQRWMSEK